MVPEANAMVLKATGIPGGGETPNANAHVNALTESIQPQRGKIDFPTLTDLEPDPVGLLGRVKGVSKKDMALVAGGNAVRLLGFT